MSHIEIDAPEARYENQALGGKIKLTIGEGENAVIIGPNGSGKSLLGTYIAGGVSLKRARCQYCAPTGRRSLA